jgi:hypothetical protein
MTTHRARENYVKRFLLLGFAAALAACHGSDDSNLVDDGDIENAANDDERAILAGLTLPKATPGTKLLMVQKGTAEVANGLGTVYDPTSTLYCDAGCEAESQEYPTGTTVTLMAQPEPGSAFLGWAGACSGPQDTCTVTMTGPRAVVANFRTTAELTARPLGAAGIIRSTDNLIDCGQTCSYAYAHGAIVDLSYQLPAGVSFVSWDGACAGAGAASTCRVALTQNTEVSAQFRNVVSVVTGGTGSGETVSRIGEVNDNEIKCGTDCMGAYSTGTVVTLVATPGADTIFDRWDNCPNPNQSPQSNVCTFTVTGPVTVRPLLRALRKQVVDVAQPGAGSVEVTYNGVTRYCSGHCEYPDVKDGENFTVRALAAANTWFERWDGPCAGRSDTCTVQPTAAGAHAVRFQHRFRLTLTGDYEPIWYRPSGGVWESCDWCTKDYPSATTVELRTATKDEINCRLFSHWEGGGCSGNNSRCTVRVDQPLDVRTVWVNWRGCIPR